MLSNVREASSPTPGSRMLPWNQFEYNNKSFVFRCAHAYCYSQPKLWRLGHPTDKYTAASPLGSCNSWLCVSGHSHEVPWSWGLLSHYSGGSQLKSVSLQDSCSFDIDQAMLWNSCWWGTFSELSAKHSRSSAFSSVFGQLFWAR